MGLTMKEMKAWLKTTTIEIRIRKSMHKQYQRDGYERAVYGCDSNGRYYWRKAGTNIDVTEFFDNMSALWKLRREYRHRHIAYSELRGKTRSQIEASFPYEGESIYTKPDEKRIDTIKNEIIETMKKQKELSACSQVA